MIPDCQPRGHPLVNRLAGQLLEGLFPNTGATGTLEQVRVMLAPLTREQIVAWWLAFHTPYRLSAALQVTGLSLG